MTKPKRYVYPFLSFFKPRGNDREQSIGLSRDVPPVMLVADVLRDLQGYELGEIYFNFPRPPNTPTDELAAVDANAGPGDLVLTGTRAPIGEEEQGDRRRMNLGFTELERVVNQLWENYLLISSRSHVVLRDWLRDWLRENPPEDHHDRADMFFYMKQGMNARYRMLGRREVDSRSTAAFILRTRELWPGGPGYLGFFGMSSETTLVLAHLLRKQLGDLLCEPAFTQLELTGPRVPKRPTDLGFANDWKAETVIRYPL